MASADLDTAESGNYLVVVHVARSLQSINLEVSSVSGEVRELLYSMRLFPRSECVFWGSFCFEPDRADTMQLRPIPQRNRPNRI